ncbi:hypothetical protein [Burkholderia pseudomallei]|uniref:hypothetical protein n=1 Tax=Burkholderia pseudomallei TaxID=28450 RepID=UPI000422C262|nr:hypothetical protein [Burkholderia pseudomallei]
MVAVALFGPDSCRAIFDATGNYRNRLLFGWCASVPAGGHRIETTGRGGRISFDSSARGARRRRRAGRGARARAYGARGALTEAPPLQNIRGQVVPAARDATERFETRA